MEKYNHKPNLFNFAYSELAQDAFICWLLSWVKPEFKNQNKILHNVAIAFLKRIFDIHGKELPYIIDTVCIEQQHKKIDILVTINDSITIIIEDKIHSTEHDDQLNRYNNIVKDEKKTNQRLLIYLQTGNQGNYTRVENAGYKRISRTDLLKILKIENSQHINNDIFNDYLEYLENIECRTNAYQQPLKDGKQWDDYAWQGFYCALQKELKWDYTKWDYVPNPQGGFWGFWGHCREDEENKCRIYIQLEEKKLCFRIEVDIPENKAKLRDIWSERILSTARKYNFNNIVRPEHKGTGNTMTMAKYDGEYIYFDNDGCLNMEKTVDLLHKAEKVLSEA